MPDPDIDALLAEASSEEEPSEEPNRKISIATPPKAPYAVAEGNFDYLAWIKAITGGGVLGIMGDSGAGKTKLCLMLADKVVQAHGTVVYLDTEANLSPEAVNSFKYEYIASMDALFQRIIKMKQGREKWDLLIVDSISIFVTARQAVLDRNEKGIMYQRVQYVLDEIKRMQMERGGSAVVIMQPASTMVNNERRPMVEKAEYFTKDLLDIKWEKSSTGVTVSRSLKFLKARDFPDQHILAKFHIDDDGAHLDEEMLAESLTYLKRVRKIQ